MCGEYGAVDRSIGVTCSEVRPLAQGGLSIKEVTPKFCGQRQRLEHEVSCKQQAPLLAVPRSPLGEGSRHLTPPTPTHPPHLAPTHLPSTSKPARPQPLIVRLSRTLFHKLRHRALLTLGAHYEKRSPENRCLFALRQTVI
jgi:hypothetical protein